MTRRCEDASCGKARERCRYTISFLGCWQIVIETQPPTSSRLLIYLLGRGPKLLRSLWLTTPISKSVVGARDGLPVSDFLPGLLAGCGRNTTSNLQSVTYLFIGAWPETTEVTLAHDPNK